MPPARDPLVSLRTLVILTAALVIAGAVGILTYLAAASLPQSVLAGGTAFAASCLFFHQIVQ